MPLSRRTSPTTVRRGLAPLELVMALPFLVLAAALIFKVAEVFVHKSAATIQARRDAAVPKSAPGPEEAPLPNNSNITSRLRPEQGQYGLIVQPAQRRAKLRPVYPGELTLTGRSSELYGTWDHRAVPFEERDNTELFDSKGRAFFLAAVPRNNSLAEITTLQPDMLSGDDSGDLRDTLQRAITQAALDAIVENLWGQYDDAFKAAKEQAKKLTNNPIDTIKDIIDAGVKGAKELLDSKDKIKDFERLITDVKRNWDLVVGQNKDVYTND